MWLGLLNKAGLYVNLLFRIRKTTPFVPSASLIDYQGISRSARNSLAIASVSPPCSPIDNSVFTVKDVTAIREQLKARGFRFDRQSKIPSCISRAKSFLMTLNLESYYYLLMILLWRILLKSTSW
jgi:hypothetical protein